MAVVMLDAFARVGVHDSIILSSIYVATTTGLPWLQHLLMICFCSIRTSSCAHLTPKSPLATMIPLHNSTILTNESASKQDGFLIFAMTWGRWSPPTFFWTVPDIGQTTMWSNQHQLSACTPNPPDPLASSSWFAISNLVYWHFTSLITHQTKCLLIKIQRSPFYTHPFLWRGPPLYGDTLFLVTHVITWEIFMTQTHEYNVCSWQNNRDGKLLYVDSS